MKDNQNIKKAKSRLVITHSTYIDGLIPWLKELIKIDGISTITPAVITKTKGRAEKLILRISTEIKGGHKLIARQGNSAQEIFVITKLDKSKLLDAIKVTGKIKKS